MITSIVPDYDATSRNGKTPEKESSREPDEWLTIAEIARLLGVDQKQVRRWRDKLSEDDRTRPGHVPQRLRLSSVLELRQQGMAGRQSLQAAPDEIDVTCPGHVLPVLLLALMTANAQQEARILELTETLAHEREVTNTMMKTLPPAPEHSSTTPEQTSIRRPWWAWRRR